MSVSPFSLDLALAMLRNGSGGQTARQIGTALQSGDASTLEQDIGLHRLVGDITAAAKTDGLQLSSANSLWTQSGLTLRPQFLAALDRYFDSGVWQTDFIRDPDRAVSALDQWASDRTHGKITKLFDHLSPDTVLVLANAIYFHAEWATAFDPARTVDAPFTTPAGKTVTAHYLSGTGLATAVGTGYQAVQLPYTGGRFAALAVMPTSASLTDFVAGLTPKRLGAIADSTRSSILQVRLPKFTTRSSVDLVPAVTALGAPDLFGAPDFSPMGLIGASVDQIRQRVYLAAGEKGTTATAATGISIGLSALAPPVPTLAFDHPFLFLIRDTTTGAILFTAQITNPSAG